MKTKPILLASLLITIFCCLGLWQYEIAVSTKVDLEKRLEKIAQNYYDEKLKNQALLARFEEFRQEVAIVLPEKQLAFDKDSHIRNLASVIPHQKIYLKQDSLNSKKILDEAHIFFVEKKYEKALKIYLDLLSRYPESSFSLEATYHLIQCFYNTDNKQEALEWAEKMLSQFPESVWTAKAMLVTADIYSDQNRKNDVIDIYQIILNTFQDKEIRDEVQKRLASARL